MTKKQLKLGAFLSTPGNHLAGWRHPDAAAESDMDFGWYMRLAQTAERTCTTPSSSRTRWRSAARMR